MAALIPNIGHTLLFCTKSSSFEKDRSCDLAKCFQQLWGRFYKCCYFAYSSTCMACQRGKTETAKHNSYQDKRKLKKERDLSNQRYYYVILLILTKRRNTMVQQKTPFYWLRDTNYYGKLTLAAAEKNWPLRTDSSPSWMQETFSQFLQNAAEFTVQKKIIHSW